MVKGQKYRKKSKNCLESHEKIWFIVGNPPPQEVGKPWAAGTQVQESSCSTVSADRPNAKWVTDISYIQTKQGVLYLSMIRDLYDNSIVAYKTSSRQTVNLVLDTIRLAMKKEKNMVAAKLQLHSDQGFQYTSQGYFNLTQSYGITPSMSSKGNPYDNAMAENFFSILKTECIYRHKPKTLKEADDLIDRFIHIYNYERIQNKTGVAPLTLRHSA